MVDFGMEVIVAIILLHNIIGIKYNIDLSSMDLYITFTLLQMLVN